MRGCVGRGGFYLVRRILPREGLYLRDERLHIHTKRKVELRRKKDTEKYVERKPERRKSKKRNSREGGGGLKRLGVGRRGGQMCHGSSKEVAGCQGDKGGGRGFSKNFLQGELSQGERASLFGRIFNICL
jgi:hypothetical protein